MSKLMAVCCGLLLAATASAGEPLLRASLLARGTILVDTDGSVESYSIENLDKLPYGARETLVKAIPQWQFVPRTEDGKPVRVSSQLTVRLELTEPVADRYEIRVADARFYGASRQQAESKATRHHRARYPASAIRAGVGGAVYAVAELNPDGSVNRAAVEQVNLFNHGSKRALERWRKVLADSALDGIRGWIFAAPEPGIEPVVRIPVVYTLGRPGEGPPDHNIWREYTPGPRQLIPWADPKLLAGSPDLLGSGQVQRLGQQPPVTLLTPLGTN